MLSTNNFYVPYLEWEAIEFPLILSDARFEDGTYQFDEPATVTVWRDTNLQLKAVLQCRLKDPRLLDADPIYSQANIMQQLVMTAINSDGHKVSIAGCVLASYSLKSHQINEKGYLIDVEVLIDTIKLVYDTRKADRHLEWFLVQNFEAHLYGSTKRSLEMIPRKLRLGIDVEDKELRLTGTSQSRDYFVIQHPEITCIIARVPKELIGKGKIGICIEFRDGQIEKLDKELLSDIKNLLSLLIGGKFYYMGYSKLIGEELTEAFLDSPDIPLNMPVAMAPIQYNMQYDWGNFALQINLLFPAYRDLQQKLNLNYSMESYWIAQTVPIGANLPILAAAIEIISSAYLKMTGNDQSIYMLQSEYENLIANELASMSLKLAKLPGGSKMLNKIKGAFQKGSNEKLNRFFEILGISLEKAETDAIKLRNKMTHSHRDYTLKDNTHGDVISTRVYQALFNRILLKLLGYKGYYKDYSVLGAPSKLL